MPMKMKMVDITTNITKNNMFRNKNIQKICLYAFRELWKNAKWIYQKTQQKKVHHAMEKGRETMKIVFKTEYKKVNR